MPRPERFELPTLWFTGERVIEHLFLNRDPATLALFLDKPEKAENSGIVDTIATEVLHQATTRNQRPELSGGERGANEGLI